MLLQHHHQHQQQQHQQHQQRMKFSSQSRAFASAALEGRNLKHIMSAAAAAAAAVGLASTLLLMSPSSAPTHCSADAPPAHVTCASDVPVTAEQLLSRVARRRNVRASGGKQGFVCWLQKDFDGRCAFHPLHINGFCVLNNGICRRDQLFACDVAAFEQLGGGGRGR